jgi:hypothetical protein
MKNLLRPGLVAIVVLLLAIPLDLAAADAQGWSGPGWYVSGSASPASKSAKEPDYVLFEGPHESQASCIAIYDKLYYPIGVCRLLTKKPGS